MDFTATLSKEFNIQFSHTENIINLIDEGNTIPFIARYRKEMTGSCDDQVLREFNDRLTYLRNLTKRKGEVSASIVEQGKMTPEILKALDEALTLAVVEDIYRPYKVKRKTRASIAIEKGLQPFADLIMKQELTTGKINDLAKEFINKEKGVNSEEDAIAGATDIIAETISDDANIRKILREFLKSDGVISTTLAEIKEDKENKEKSEDLKTKALTYDMYKEYNEKVAKIPSHRVLAINRGENESCLKVSIVIDKDAAISKISNIYIKGESIFKDIMNNAIIDSYTRLIFPSLEREIRTDLTDKADEQAIKMFEVNLKPLLMQSPLKGKTVLGLDPAYRTGCKIAVVDNSGNVLATDVVYPTPPQSKIEEAIFKLKALIEKFNVEIISIGNGTASKESEIFVVDLIKRCSPRKISYMVVNEAGASVYSASKLGAEEFPEFDVSLRSAVSIARRLQDPLAELIKIDVKSIGVGQYQHDMPQNRLTDVLNGVVEDCVNSVGVDLNTASVSLLTFVAGLNSGIAKNIVDYRKSKPFESREDLLSVKKLGAKAYEQCAGFLRIPKGKNLLDNTGVHPESYNAVNKLLDKLNYTVKDIAESKINNIKQDVTKLGVEKVAESIGVGVPTLNDIIDELLKPGRDIRDSLPQPILRSDLLDLNDLKPGMELDGTVRNVIDFGAFIDIGVHQDGLVHISEISDSFISHPSEVLKVGDVVKVKVLNVDPVRKKISLTMKTQSNKGGVKPNTSNRNNQKSESIKREPEDLNSMLKALQAKFSR